MGCAVGTGVGDGTAVDVGSGFGVGCGVEVGGGGGAVGAGMGEGDGASAATDFQGHNRRQGLRRKKPRKEEAADPARSVQDPRRRPSRRGGPCGRPPSQRRHPPRVVWSLPARLLAQPSGGRTMRRRRVPTRGAPTVIGCRKFRGRNRWGRETSNHHLTTFMKRLKCEI